MKSCLTLLLGLLTLASAAAAEYSTPQDWDLGASFPAPPTAANADQQSVLGPIKVVTLTAENGEDSFVMIEMFFPIALPEDRLGTAYEVMKQSVLRQGKAVLTRETDTAIADHEGRCWLIDFPDEKQRGDFRIFAIGQIMYLAGYSAPAARYSEAAAKTFFRSIRQRSAGAEAMDSGETPALSPGSSIVVHRAAPVAQVSAPPEHWDLAVSFLGQPKETSGDFPSAVGPGTQVTRVLAHGQIMFGISRVSFPVKVSEDQVEAVFESTKQNLLSRGVGTLKREEKLPVAGLDGRRYVMEFTHEFADDDYRVDNRLVMLDQVIYIVYYRAPINVYSPADARAFFNSAKRTTR